MSWPVVMQYTDIYVEGLWRNHGLRAANSTHQLTIKNVRLLYYIRRPVSIDNWDNECFMWFCPCILLHQCFYRLLNCLIRPCDSSGGSDRDCPESTSGPVYVWDLWCSEWHLGQSFTEYRSRYSDWLRAERLRVRSWSSCGTRIFNSPCFRDRL
jgi:hypothetical protein